MNTISNLEQLDHIFSLIKHQNQISYTDIYANHYAQLKSYEIDKRLLASILTKLTTDGLIIADGEEYSISIEGNGFAGYVNTQSEVQRKSDLEKTDKRIDKYIKFITITLSVLFGMTTIYFNHSNQKNLKESNSKSLMIDSLRKEINFQKNKIDSLQSRLSKP